MGCFVEDFVVRWVVEVDWKIAPTMVHFSQVKWLRWSTISGHPSGRWKHTDHRCHIFCNCTITCVSQDFGIYILSLSSHVIADILLKKSVQCHRFACCNGSTRKRKVVVCPDQISHTAHLKHAVIFGGYKRQTLFTGYESKYKNQSHESKRFTCEKRSSHAESLREEMSEEEQWVIHFQHFLQYLQISLRHNGIDESDDDATGICQQVATPRTRRIWKHSLESGISGVKHQKPNFWSNDTQRILKPWKETLDLRHSSRSAFPNRSPWTSKTGKRSRQSGCERTTKLWWCKNFQVFRIDMKDEWKNKRWVAQVVGSEAREALCGQRNPVLQEHQVLLQATEGEQEFVTCQMQSELQSHNVRYRRTLHDLEVQHEQISQHLEFQEAQLRTQLQTEELLMMSVKENFQENSESERTVAGMVSL